MKVITTFFIGLFLTFCSHQPSVLEQVRARGELRVLTVNSPTTFYENGTGLTGFEYDLTHRFAEELGVALKPSYVNSADEVLTQLAGGHGDIGAAALRVTGQRKALVRFGPVYKEIVHRLVYRQGSPVPRTLKGLAGRHLAIAKDSPEAELLREQASAVPGLDWEEIDGVDQAALMARVWKRELDYTIVKSDQLALTRHYYPELMVAFDVGDKMPIAWAFPQDTDDSLYIAAIHFFNKLRRSGELQQITERHFGHIGQYDYVSTRRLLQHIRERLPRYRPMFEAAALATGLDWRLLAAIGYQESHWNPDAKSPTGVRGIMMLTQSTAQQVGVKDRTDPAQSIAGGARYFRRVRNKIPTRIPEPDRTWFALASYNIGFGHLEDARKLAQVQGKDPDKWIDVKTTLPLLQDKQWYEKTRHGYARGREPVRYVDNVRRYFDLLVWRDRQPPWRETPDPAAGTNAQRPADRSPG